MGLKEPVMALSPDNLYALEKQRIQMVIPLADEESAAFSCAFFLN